ncbi:MAG: hypothetical protein OXD01_10840 [Gammaproteobacteria bacterium]|nr:hypothetical protein [Gammaproteobacteria bacterium]
MNFFGSKKQAGTDSTDLTAADADTKEILNEITSNSLLPPKKNDPDFLVNRKQNHLHEIVRLLSPYDLEQLVAEVLATEAKGEYRNARMSIDSAIDSCKPIKIRGFSRASKAKPEVLIEPIMEYSLETPRLLGSLLRLWKELNAPLCGRIRRRLEGLGVPVEEVDFKNGLTFNYIWERELWESEVGILTEQETELLNSVDTESVTDTLRWSIPMMLGITAGTLPAHAGEGHAANIESEQLASLLNWLFSLPHLHPIWMEMHHFTHALVILTEDKCEKRLESILEYCESKVQNFLDDYEFELSYLEFDTEQLQIALENYPEALLHSSTEDFNALGEQLEHFREILPLGDSITEEKKRSAERTDLASEIIEKLNDWTDKVVKRMEEIKREEGFFDTQSEESIVKDVDKISEADELDLETVRNSLQSEKSKNSDLKARYDEQGEKLRDLKQALVRESKAKKKLAEEIARLTENSVQAQRTLSEESVLSENRELSSYQVQYHPKCLETARDAVNQAVRTFSDELLLSLNSKSQVKTAFGKPEEIFAALAWLASDYRDHMLNPEPGVEFNEKLRVVCPNWFYIPRQSTITSSKYADWYETTVNGSVYELQEHIGRGKSHDSKSNIRIAFAWSEKEGKVVIGFIGRHQKTDKA